MSSVPPPPPAPPPPPGMMPPTSGAAGAWAAGTSPFGPLATWVERVLASLIDGVLLVVVYIVGLILLRVASILGLLIMLAFIALSFYFLYLNGSVGQTPGKKVMGLKVVSETTGQTIGGGSGIGRGLLHVVDSFICGIGYLFPLWDAKRQTLADKIIKSVVLSGVPKVAFADAVKTSLPNKG